MDIHQPSVLQGCSLPVSLLSAIPVFADSLLSVHPESVIVAPDQGAVEKACHMADLLKIPLAIMHKQRMADHSLLFELVSGCVKGKACYLVDDIYDSGRTLCLAAGFLKQLGACQVEAFVTHGIFSQGSVERLNRSAISRLTVSNSLPRPDSTSAKIYGVDISPLLAKALYRS